MTAGSSAGRLAAFTTAVLIFAWLAERVATGSAIVFDATFRTFAHRHASPGLTELMRLASYVGETVPLLVLSVLAFAVLLAAHSSRAAAFFAITMGGAFVLDATLKLAFHRPRPPAFFGTPEPGSYSFPSGHAIFAACYFGILAAFAAARFRGRAARILVWSSAAIIAGLIGYSRIYLGVHYPSDVVAGYAASIVWLTAAAWGDRRWGA
jgi:undecaprenyl-diphosphatase